MRDTKRMEWMSQGKFGIMVHYLPDPKNDNFQQRISEFNNIVDNFNIDTFMASFDRIGADWLIFTSGQCTGLWNSYCEPIENRIKGVCSKRDLVLEIAKEVKKRGKRFIFYIPGECYYLQQYHPEFIDVYNHKLEDKGAEFIKLWREVYKYYATKFGDLIDAWWIDGCYEHLHQNTWDWKDLGSMCRSGNPNCGVAFSDGSFCINKFTNISDENDYFPGETHLVEHGILRHENINECGMGEMCSDGIIRYKGEAPKYFTPKEKYIDGSLLHALCCFFGPYTLNSIAKNEWFENEPCESWAKLINDFNKVGGAITYNLLVSDKGEIDHKQLEIFDEIKSKNLIKN